MVIMDVHSEEKLAKVSPQLAVKVRDLFDKLMAEGIEIRVVQGLRTWQEQDDLYNKGRTVPPLGKGHVVTNAKGGQSMHNFGLAVDVVPFVNGAPDWKLYDAPNKMKDNWARMIEIGESIGLFSGHRFKTIDDCPHFQLTGRFPASPTGEMLGILKDNGLQAVWDAAYKV
jgi:peptidoglycan L-alanyl-D-glutamate endopeptidase CwlK